MRRAATKQDIYLITQCRFKYLKLGASLGCPDDIGVGGGFSRLDEGDLSLSGHGGGSRVNVVRFLCCSHNSVTLKFGGR